MEIGKKLKEARLNRDLTKKCTDRSRAYPGEGCRENRCFPPDYFQLGK